MTEREMLLQRIGTLDFAAFEAHLFLDTHPNNQEMLKKFNEYKSKSAELRQEFEGKFGPLTSAGQETHDWQWIAAPWPWENS